MALGKGIKRCVTRAGVVATWVKPLLATPAFCLRAPLGVLAALLLIQLPGKAGKAMENAPSTWTPGTQAPALELAQPWPLWLSNESISEYKILSLFLAIEESTSGWKSLSLTNFFWGSIVTHHILCGRAWFDSHLHCASNQVSS